MVATQNRCRLLDVSLFRRAVMLPLVVGAMLAAGCGWEGARFAQTATLAAPHVPASGLNVRTRNGSVQVHRAGTADGQVSITATLRMATQERLGQATIEASRNSSGVLEISAKPPDGGWRSSEGCSFDITVPEASGVDLSTGNGSIEIGGLSGAAKLDTSNGAIRVKGHDGAVEAHTSNGRIEASDVAGAVDVQSSNGSITIALGARSTGPAKIHTSNGSVTLELSSAFRGELDVQTSNGSIRVPSSPPAGVNTFSSRVERRTAHLAVGQGGPSSSIKTSNGSVTVKFGG